MSTPTQDQLEEALAAAGSAHHEYEQAILDGKRDEAKKIYNELVKQKTDDGGVSLWPHAAAYRLEWWRAID